VTASEDDLVNVVDMIWTLLAAQTVTTEHDATVAATTSDFAASLIAASEAFRQSVDASFEDGRGVMEAALISLAHHDASAPERDIETVMDRIYEWFVAQSKTIEERAFTFGAVSLGGGNVGDGTVRRLVVDENDHELQSTHSELKLWTCRRDSRTGTQRHKAEFEVKGTAQGPTLFLQRKSADNQGSGVGVSGIPSFADSDSLVLNPSFDVVTVAAGQPTTGADAALGAADTVNDWTVDDTTLLSSTVDDSYRDDPATGAGLHKALILEGNLLMTQNWVDKGISINPDQPYWCQLAVKRLSSADGTLTVRVGSTTFSVNVTTYSNGVWNLLIPATPTTNHLLWGKQINEDAATFEIQLSSNTTGTVVIDGFGVWPMRQIDGQWYAPVSGATDFKIDDTASHDTTLTAEGKIQALLWTYFGRHLPHNATPSIADPA